MFGRCYLFCEIRKQDGWIYVKSNWRRTGFIDLYDIILQVIHTGNCGLTDKKVHQYAGDRYKQSGDQCQTPLQGEFFGIIFHDTSSIRIYPCPILF